MSPPLRANSHTIFGRDRVQVFLRGDGANESAKWNIVRSYSQSYYFPNPVNHSESPFSGQI